MAGIAAVSLSRAEDAVPKSGTLLLLHYRWRHDTLKLIESQRVKAAVKVSRSRNRDARDQGTETARSPFSYEVISADGSLIAIKYLHDPGLRQVEVQDRGEHQLHREQSPVDSSDIFLRVPEPDAKAIRFYRHGTPGPAAKRSEGAAAGLGPEPAPSKTLIAEFPLE